MTKSRAKKKKVGVIDFFCGCGGTSKGFQLADMPHLEFEIIVGVDFDSSCCATFETSVGARAVNLDIRELYNIKGA